MNFVTSNLNLFEPHLEIALHSRKFAFNSYYQKVLQELSDNSDNERVIYKKTISFISNIKNKFKTIKFFPEIESEPMNFLSLI